MAKAPSKTLKVKRTGSPLRREPNQGKTLLGLGLKRANQVVELENTPSVRGMIRTVGHLVEVEEGAGWKSGKSFPIKPVASA